VSAKKPREIALEVLDARAGNEFVEERLQRALTGERLSPADRGLCQELVYGAVRWQATLDWLIKRKAQKRPPGATLRTLLRLGLYQIFWLTRIPPHAAVHQTVELAKQGGSRSHAAVVNAILRGYLREEPATRRLLAELKLNQPALGYSHPAWLVQRWQQRWGLEDAIKLMDWNNTPPKTFARVNTLKAEPRQLVSRWRDEGVSFESIQRDWLEDEEVFQLESHPPLEQLPSFQQGWFYVQDPSTLLAVRELAPQPGETVLDLCAAPGGKLIFMAQLMRNQGRLVAHETSRDRLKLVEQNCLRLGVTCVESALPAMLDPAVVPGATTADGPPLGGLAQAGGGVRAFDRILIDAPCSNTGVMRRRVDLRWRIRPAEIQRLRAGQLHLLAQGARLLKPGGILVYSTCSLEPEENEGVVAEFLDRHPQFVCHYRRELVPIADGVDGAYVARLRAAAD
jgi:16S rRNA (cytosine967-C5)-methyltransferase